MIKSYVKSSTLKILLKIVSVGYCCHTGMFLKPWSKFTLNLDVESLRNISENKVYYDSAGYSENKGMQ